MKLTNFPIHSWNGMLSADRLKGPGHLHVLMAIIVCIGQTANQGLPPRPSSQVIPTGSFGVTQGITPKNVFIRDGSGLGLPLIQSGYAHDCSEHVDRHLGRCQFQLVENLQRKG